MIKESEAQVIASVAAAMATSGPDSTRRLLVNKEDEITDKVLPEVFSISLRFAGLL